MFVGSDARFSPGGAVGIIPGQTACEGDALGSPQEHPTVVVMMLAVKLHVGLNVAVQVRDRVCVDVLVFVFVCVFVMVFVLVLVFVFVRVQSSAETLMTSASRMPAMRHLPLFAKSILSLSKRMLPSAVQCRSRPGASLTADACKRRLSDGPSCT